MRRLPQKHSGFGDCSVPQHTVDVTEQTNAAFTSVTFHTLSMCRAVSGERLALLAVLSTNKGNTTQDNCHRIQCETRVVGMLCLSSGLESDWVRERNS